MSKTSTEFFKLTTDRVLDCVESAMSEVKPNIRATGRILALNSLENRVYEIEFEDKSFVVAKFYRPNRWTPEQILEEHEFLNLLSNAEIPVVTAFPLKAHADSKIIGNSSVKSLAQTKDKICFAVFPKVRGRLVDELSPLQLETLGRYVGRIHLVGKSWRPKHRLQLSVKAWVRNPLSELLRSPFLDEHTRPHYQAYVERFAKLAEERLEGIPSISVHGDCHLGNTLWSDEVSPFFLDFDDTMVAPAVQDIWMIIRGRDEEAEEQRNILLKAYEQMNDFDRSSLALIEVLRGLRIIHYSAWIAKRWDDPSFPKAFPQFGSPSYWRGEMEALMEIEQILEQTA